MRRITIIGSGLSGLEAAKTLVRTVSDAQITLLGPDRDITILPNLVYVPFGMRPSTPGSTAT